MKHFWHKYQVEPCSPFKSERLLDVKQELLPTTVTWCKCGRIFI